MIKNIIFDFDGVLVDSEILVAKAFSKYLFQKNIIFSEKDFSIFAGKKTVQVISEISEKFNIENQKIFFDDIMDIVNEIFNKNLKPVDGAKNFLLKSKLNFLIGSNSNKDRILVGLKKVHLDHFFKNDKIFSFDMVKKAKPSPDIYLKAIEMQNLNKNETIIIEDSSVGVKAGVASGVRVIGITAGQHWFLDRSPNELLKSGASLLINNYDELLECISSL